MGTTRYSYNVSFIASMRQITEVHSAKRIQASPIGAPGKLARVARVRRTMLPADDVVAVRVCMKRYLFAIISRVGMTAYSLLPVFGSLRASLAVIREADQILVIERSDGRGLSFPGGLVFPWETDEQGLAREVSEETGLRVKECEPLFSYWADDEIPCTIKVFAVKAEGKLNESWEGSPNWLTIDEIRPAVMKSQQAIVSRLR